MKNQTCCFTGHREIPAGEENIIKERLTEVLTSLIEEGITDFLAGGAIGFDMLAEEVVLSLREKYPHIRLHIIVPCSNQPLKWSSDNVRKYEDINSKADEVKLMSQGYYRGCMQVRNRYMVDNSSVCVAYLTKTTGGSAGTVRDAEKKGLKIINVAEKL